MTIVNAFRPTIPAWQLVAVWLCGLLLCVYGLFDGVALWSYGYSLVMLLILAAAPVVWNWRGRRRLRPVTAAVPRTRFRCGVQLAVLAACSLGMSVGTSLPFGDLPPAYHDEFSYLFQAKTYLAGRLWFPLHPMHPELFDQMHVLNDHGRMASRYFPATGLWMAPFVALNHPYLGHWLCNLLITWFVYAAGCELRNARTGFLAGLLTALSPGLALFGNLLLAHQPTLLGLSFFLWRMTRLQRSGSSRDAWAAGFGLAWAMLCRPMTAAGFALPYGVWTAVWLTRSSVPWTSRRGVFFGFAVPLLSGFAIQLGDNAAITGNPWTSPYQLYTETYTPRHVFGFDNVVRGEQRLGPKVLDGYDRWAENLTPSIAAENVWKRLVNSLLFTWDLLPLGMAGLLWILLWPRWDWRQRLPGCAIVTLHAVHIPYWYAGIMDWHYVFESLILWTLIAACVLDECLSDWRQAGKPLMAGWLLLFCVVPIAENLVTVPEVWKAKVTAPIATIRYPRRKQAEFREWVFSTVRNEPALVLVAPHRDEGHLDYVINDPGLTSPLLFGRFRPGKTDAVQIARDFPDRQVWLCEPDQHRLRKVGE